MTTEDLLSALERLKAQALKRPDDQERVVMDVVALREALKQAEQHALDNVTLNSFCKAHGTPMMVLSERDRLRSDVACLRAMLQDLAGDIRRDYPQWAKDITEALAK